jgi:NAD(P)-dependent dehydrogenase (short-subunit alcohol dehydrogenase family)
MELPMNEDLKGKYALITGAGKKSGIGYAIAQKLASFGAHVIIADLGIQNHQEGQVQTGTRDEMEEIARELGKEYAVKTLAVELDVTRSDTIERMVSKVSQFSRELNILCNNAGATFGVPNAVHTYDEEAWMKTIDVNLHSVFRVTRALLPFMLEHGGSIINTASRAGKVPALFNGAYSVAKAGVIMLSKVMALELAGNRIRVNAVCPGQIMTDLEKWRFGLEAQIFNTTPEDREEEMCKSIPLNRIGTPREVADLVAFLASDRSSYITGQAVNVTGGQLMEL